MCFTTGVCRKVWISKKRGSTIVIDLYCCRIVMSNQENQCGRNFRKSMLQELQHLRNFLASANGPRLAAQLTMQEAKSAFTPGGLHPGIIAASEAIIAGPKLNRHLAKRLTANGTNIRDWAKMSTQSIKSPSGGFKVHSYQNLKTGGVHYGDDFKSVLNHQGERR